MKILTFILLSALSALHFSPAKALEIKQLTPKAITPVKTTGNQITQQWTIAKSDNVKTISKLEIELVAKPAGFEKYKRPLQCRYREQKDCTALWINRDVIPQSDPVTITLNMPVVGRYTLRVTTKVKTSTNNVAYEVHDAVFERDPAPAAYRIDPIPELFITQGWNFRSAARPVFLIRSEGNNSRQDLTSSLTATLDNQEDISQTSRIGTPLTCSFDLDKEANCVSIRSDLISPTAPLMLPVTLKDFVSAGRYHVKFETSDPLSMPAAIEFVLNVREHWSLAFLFVFGGVFTAFAIKWLISQSLPALKRRQTVAEAGRRLVTYFNGLVDPDNHTQTLATWLNSNLQQAADGLNEVILDDERVAMLVELPGLFQAWAQVYRSDATAESDKTALRQASDAFKSTTVTRDQIEAFRNKIRISGRNLQTLAREALSLSTPYKPNQLASWPQTQRRIARAIFSQEMAVNLFVLVIAAISGVTALWATNLVWGQSGDYITAFFWGAGAKAITDGAVGYLDINKALRDSLGG